MGYSFGALDIQMGLKRQEPLPCYLLHNQQQIVQSIHLYPQ